MKIVSAVLLVVLAVIGAAYLIREITARLFGCSSEKTVMLITFPGDSSEEVEAALRSALSRYGNKCKICAKSAPGSEQEKIIRSVCREYGAAQIDIKQLRSIIDTMEQKTTVK